MVVEMGIGRYRIGQAQNCVTVDFALEAKCHSLSAGLGVKVLSRLISRLKHRQFGILVTTTFLSHQAYQELVEGSAPDRGLFRRRPCRASDRQTGAKFADRDDRLAPGKLPNSVHRTRRRFVPLCAIFVPRRFW